jgi:parallel beta-helix repeat protein
MPVNNPPARIFALMSLIFAAPLAGAAEYAVATNGDDANPGTESQPWRTLQHAADSVGPGDTVSVRAGNYAGAYIENSGTSSQPIVFRAFGNEAPSITEDNPETPDGINVEGASYVTVQGFTVNGRSRAGIRAATCDHVTIRDNRIDGSGKWGIFTAFCDDVVIDHNVTANTGEQHGIYVSNSGDRPIVRNNTIYGNTQAGIHMNGDISNGGDGIISDALVENNVIWDNGSGGASGINCDGVQDSLIRNNLIFDEHASGISLYRIDGGGASTGNRVLNNTVLVAADGRWALNIQDGSSNNTARNNILLNANSSHGAIDIGGDSLDGFSADHNAVTDRFTTNGGDSVLSLSEWRGETGNDGNSFVSASSNLFENPGGDDYSLSSSSPAVDAGEMLADVPADLLGVARPQGAGFDIGAYEREDGGGGDEPDEILANGFD